MHVLPVPFSPVMDCIIAEHHVCTRGRSHVVRHKLSKWLATDVQMAEYDTNVNKTYMLVLPMRTFLTMGGVSNGDARNARVQETVGNMINGIRLR